jgi:hypothetical protein
MYGIGPTPADRIAEATRRVLALVAAGRLDPRLAAKQLEQLNRCIRRTGRDRRRDARRRVASDWSGEERRGRSDRRNRERRSAQPSA